MRSTTISMLALLVCSVFSAAARADSLSPSFDPAGQMPGSPSMFHESLSELPVGTSGKGEDALTFVLEDEAGSAEPKQASAPAPEPSSLLLLGTGLMGAGMLGTFGAARRRVFGDAFGLASFVRGMQAAECGENRGFRAETGLSFGVPREQF